MQSSGPPSNREEQGIPPETCPRDDKELFKVTDMYGSFIVCVECGYIRRVTDAQANKYRPLQSEGGNGPGAGDGTPKR